MSTKSKQSLNVTIMLGDFSKYLEHCEVRFDVIVASGVLYHISDPVRLLQSAARVTNSIGVWTDYYDAQIVGERADLQKKFDKAPRIEQVGSREVQLYKQSYLEALIGRVSAEDRPRPATG
jgi:SAM-dependent methyltransferase